MDEIDSMSKTTSIICRQTETETDSSVNVDSQEKKKDISQITSSRINGNFVVIWLDPTIDTNDKDTEYSISQIQCIVSDFRTFTDADECMDFLTNIINEKAFMIISGHFGYHILSFMQVISQLHSIYIFRDYQAKPEELVKECKKVKGIFNHIESICNALKQDVRQCDINMAPISVMSIPSAIDLDRLEPSFMYSQLLKENLLSLEHHEEAKTIFAEFCRDNYADNTAQLDKINLFEHEYRQHSAIWWYTKEPFIYSILNKALRTQDTSVIMKMAFFIKDLYQNIEELYKKSQETSKISVYRGQGMSHADFKKLQDSKGALLSFNNFLSTSVDRDVSNMFAVSASGDPNLTGILFKIEINPLVSKVPFASLDKISHHSDDEKEILFSMHTIFRITEVEEISDRLWEVSLALTNDNDQELNQLTHYIRGEIGDQTGWNSLGLLMLKMGDLNNAEQIFKSITELICANDDAQLLPILGVSYSNLGNALITTGKYSTALKYLEKALKIEQKSLSHNHPDLTATNSNIGVVYQSTGEYSTALSCFKKILDIQHQTLPHDHPNLASTYNNIGMVYQLIGKYSKALSYFKKTLDIQQQALPQNHPDLATTNNNIGMTYRSTGDNSTALLYYQKALEIQQRTLPHNHPDLAAINNNIGMIYQSTGEHSTALPYLKKTLEIQQQTLPDNHPDLATTNNNIGMVYRSTGEYSVALSYFEKTLKIQQQTLPHNHQDLATSNNNIGTIYQSTGDYSTAISYFKKALKIQQQVLPHNHPNLARTNNNIGAIYQFTGKYSTALLYFTEALEIQQKTLPHNHQDLATSNNNIGTIYRSTGEYLTALSYFNKALEIQQHTLPHNHSDLATTNGNIGAVYLSTKEYPTALSYFKKTLDIQQQALPHNHPDLAMTYNYIGTTHFEMRSYNAALFNLENALKIASESCATNIPLLVDIYANNAAVLYALGRHEEAVNYAKKSVHVAQCRFGLNHSKTEMLQNFLDGLQQQSQ